MEITSLQQITQWFFPDEEFREMRRTSWHHLRNHSAIFDAVVKGSREEVENDDDEEDVMLDVAAACPVFVLEL